MTIFLDTDIQSDTVGVTIIEAISMSVAALTGIPAGNLQTVLAAIVSKTPDNAAGLAFTPVPNLSATDVQAAIATIQTSLDGVAGSSLTAAEERFLQQQTEVSQSTFADAPNSTLARSDGGTPPAPITPFVSELSLIAYNGVLFFDLPDTVVDLTGYRVRVFDTFGIPTGQVLSLEGSTMETGAGAGFQRWLSTGIAALALPDKTRVQIETVTIVSYDLGSLVKIAATSLTGFIAQTQLDPEVRAILNAASVGKLTRNQELFFLEATIAESVPGVPFGTFKFKAGPPSHDLTEYADSAIIAEIPGQYTVLVPDGNRVLHVLLSNGVMEQTQDVGVIVTGFRGYTFTMPSNIVPPANAQVIGGAETLSKVTFSPKIQIGALNLEANVLNRLIENGHESFFDHVILHGSPADLDINSFHIASPALLPLPDINTTWAAITNGNVPQNESTLPSEAMILLPAGIYPLSLTWTPGTDQPAGTADPINLNEFVQVPGEQVPEGFNAFIYIAPAFTQLSEVAGFGKLKGGAINRTDVTEINFQSIVKIRDVNLDLTQTDQLSTTDREKLDALRFIEFQNDSLRERPGMHFSVPFATLWPDPDVNYIGGFGDPPYSNGVPNKPAITGMSLSPRRVYNVRSGFAFAITQPSSNTVFSNIYGRTARQTDQDGGPAIVDGELIVADNGLAGQEQFVIDDRGVVMCATIHTLPTTVRTAETIFQIGTGTPRIEFGLEPSGAGLESFFEVTVFRGNPSATTSVVQRATDLQDAAGSGYVHHFGTDVGEITSGDGDFLVPLDWLAPIAATVSIQLLENGNDDGTITVDVLLPTNGDIATDGPVINATIAFPGQPSEIWVIQYITPGSPITAGTPRALDRVIRVTPPTRTNAALDYLVSARAVHNVTITHGAGTEIARSLGLSIGPTRDRYDIAMHVRSNFGTIEYRIAINGVFVADVTNTFESAPAGAQQLRWGQPAGTMAMNRMLVLRPNTVNSVTSTDLALLSQRASRNALYANLLQAIGTIREVSGNTSSVISLASNVIIETGNGGVTQLASLALSDGQFREFRLEAGGTELVAEIDFAAMVAINVELTVDGVLVKQTGVTGGKEIEIDLTVREKDEGSGGTGTLLAGPDVTGEIDVEVINGSRSNHRFTRGVTRAIAFKKGQAYQFRLVVSPRGGGWPTANFVSVQPGDLTVSLAIVPALTT